MVQFRARDGRPAAFAWTVPPHADVSQQISALQHRYARVTAASSPLRLRYATVAAKIEKNRSMDQCTIGAGPLAALAALRASGARFAR